MELLLYTFCWQAHVELKIPKEHHKFIIGRDKAQQKKIELATATKILIPRPSEQSDDIRIVGTREGVEKARHQIQMISDKQVRRGRRRDQEAKCCVGSLLGFAIGQPVPAACWGQSSSPKPAGHCHLS